MNCDAKLIESWGKNHGVCISKDKREIIQLAIQCKILDKRYDIEDICKLINHKYQTDNQYKKLCMIQDV